MKCANKFISSVNRTVDYADNIDLLWYCQYESTIIRKYHFHLKYLVSICHLSKCFSETDPCNMLRQCYYAYFINL